LTSVTKPTHTLSMLPSLRICYRSSS
jgi:hypothetical protein